MEEVIRNRRHKALVEKLIIGVSREELLAELLEEIPESAAAAAIDDAVDEIVSRHSSPHFAANVREIRRRKFSGPHDFNKYLSWVFLLPVGLAGVLGLVAGRRGFVEFSGLFVFLGAIALLTASSRKLGETMRESEAAVDRLVDEARISES